MHILYTLDVTALEHILGEYEKMCIFINIGGIAGKMRCKISIYRNSIF